MEKNKSYSTNNTLSEPFISQAREVDSLRSWVVVFCASLFFCMLL